MINFKIYIEKTSPTCFSLIHLADVSWPVLPRKEDVIVYERDLPGEEVSLHGIHTRELMDLFVTGVHHRMNGINDDIIVTVQKLGSTA